MSKELARVKRAEERRNERVAMRDLIGRAMRLGRELSESSPSGYYDVSAVLKEATLRWQERGYGVAPQTVYDWLEILEEVDL